MTAPTVPFYPITHDDGLSIVSALNGLVDVNDTPSLLADPFDEAVSYAVGNYVIYAGALYRFTSAHSAGPWNSNHVTQVITMNELKSVITTLNGKMNATPACIELNPGAGTNIGGYIDFHYNGSTADYTSRIIETENVITIVGKPLALSHALQTGYGGTGGSDSRWLTYTNSSVFTGNIYYRKIGKFVTVIAKDIYLKTALSSAGSFVTLGTMPSGIYSKVNTSTRTLASTQDPGILTLKSNRDLSFNCGKNASWPTTWGISFTLSFITSD